MSSLRQDSLTGRWVIIAAQRQGRPNDFRAHFQGGEAPDPASDHCPFCSGRENQTPLELLATGRSNDMPADGPGWRVRVVPNKYPAVQAQQPSSDLPDSSPLRPQVLAQGDHEVIICCPEHQETLGSLAPDRLTEVFSVVRQRVKTLGENDTPGRYILVFGNQGPNAGATLAHSHLQIISTPVVPALVVDKTENFIRHKNNTNSCLLCDCIAEEEESGTRLIASNRNWVALAPWASRFPCEMRLIPRRHCPSILDCTDVELADLADLVSLCLKGLNNYRHGAGYNVVIHNEALKADGHGGDGNERLDSLKGNTPDLFHWHLEILPRLSRQAGFEAGTGFAINSLPPEEAAVILRPERR